MTLAVEDAKIKFVDIVPDLDAVTMAKALNPRSFAPLAMFTQYLRLTLPVVPSIGLISIRSTFILIVCLLASVYIEHCFVKLQSIYFTYISIIHYLS